MILIKGKGKIHAMNRQRWTIISRQASHWLA